MQNKIGQQYTGTIVSVTNFGFFVQLDAIAVDGLVHISSLGDDYYDYNAELNALEGRRNKHKVYMLGDTVTVRVASVNIINKYIDFKII